MESLSHCPLAAIREDKHDEEDKAYSYLEEEEAETCPAFGEEDFKAVSLSSGAGVRKAKLFCKFTEATVLVTAEVLLLNSSMEDLFPRILQPKGEASEGFFPASKVILFASVSVYFCGKLYIDQTPIVSLCPSAVAAEGACLFSPQPSGAVLIASSF